MSTKDMWVEKLRHILIPLIGIYATDEMIDKTADAIVPIYKGALYSLSPYSIIPAQEHEEGGWKVDVAYLSKIKKMCECDDRCPDDVDLEQIEAVILALKELGHIDIRPESSGP